MGPITRMFGAVATAFGLSVACSPGEPSSPIDTGKLSEASMNLDLEDVRPFLSRLPALVEGFRDADAQQLSDAIATLPVESERSWSFAVRYQGTEVPLQVRAFMDDVDAPDLHFFSSPALAGAIQEELSAYAESLGERAAA